MINHSRKLAPLLICPLSCIPDLRGCHSRALPWEGGWALGYSWLGWAPDTNMTTPAGTVCLLTPWIQAQASSCMGGKFIRSEATTSHRAFEVLFAYFARQGPTHTPFYLSLPFGPFDTSPYPLSTFCGPPQIPHAPGKYVESVLHRILEPAAS